MRPYVMCLVGLAMFTTPLQAQSVFRSGVDLVHLAAIRTAFKRENDRETLARVGGFLQVFVQDQKRIYEPGLGHQTVRPDDRRLGRTARQGQARGRRGAQGTGRQAVEFPPGNQGHASSVYLFERP